MIDAKAMFDANTTPKSASLETATFKDHKFGELFAVLEDLLKRIADTDDPEIRRKRAQVRAEMIAVRNNLAGAALNAADSGVAHSDGR